MAEETQEERDERVREEGRQAAREYDSWAEERGLPTNEQIERDRAIGGGSGLYFGTGTGTSVGDFPLNTADSLAKATAINEAIASNGAIVVDSQPGGATNVATTDSLSAEERQQLSNAGVRDAGNPEERGSADAHVEGRNPTPLQPVGPDGEVVSGGATENLRDDAPDDDGDPNTRTAKEIVADIEAADSTEKVDELATEGEKFATVQTAAEKRRRELSEPSE